MTAAAPLDDAPPPARPTLTVVPPAAAYLPLDLCICGHEPDAHEHHRPGNECGVCGPIRCRRFRRRTGRGARSSVRR